MMQVNAQTIRYEFRPPFWVAHFVAMACPCELLIATPRQEYAQKIAQCAANEVWRIEQKYSRYTQTGIVAALNKANGQAIVLDNETRDLFIYAQQLFTLSEGLFDISSGCLKTLWQFHQKNTTPCLPSHLQVMALLPLIGLEKIQLSGNQLTLPAGMQIDFGGIGKEYAADKALLAVGQFTEVASIPCLVNLGGDIVANTSLRESPWHIGFREDRLNTSPASAQEAIRFEKGAVATSGISERQWIINGKSYSHILNPKTGWPIVNPPYAVTVVAPTCMQAGMLTTLIMLQGENAEAFVAREDIQCWIKRH